MPRIVQKGDMFEDKVVPFLHEFRVLLEESQTFSVGAFQPFVKLVQFHQDAAVGRIQAESLLHAFQGCFLIPQLVEPHECQVAPDCGERRIQPCGNLPKHQCEFVLPFVIV